MELSESIKIRVRFSEVDSIRMVWHGNYVTYLEDAREAFGRKYGLEYKTILENNSYAPMFELNLKYKQMVSVDDKLIVNITFIPTKGGKICFKYEVYNAKNNTLVLTASSIQLFTDLNGNLDPMPEWFEEWKNRNHCNA